MTIKELASELGISTATINLWIKSGKLNGKKVFNKYQRALRWIFDDEAVKTAKELRSKMKNKIEFKVD